MTSTWTWILLVAGLIISIIIIYIGTKENQIVQTELVMDIPKLPDPTIHQTSENINDKRHLQFKGNYPFARSYIDDTYFKDSEIRPMDRTENSINGVECDKVVLQGEPAFNTILHTRKDEIPQERAAINDNVAYTDPRFTQRNLNEPVFHKYTMTPATTNRTDLTYDNWVYEEDVNKVEPITGVDCLMDPKAESLSQLGMQPHVSPNQIQYMPNDDMRPGMEGRQRYK